MTVIRKPRTVDDFIGGAAVAAETGRAVESTADILPVKLRLPADFLKEIDETRSLRKPRPSRHQYILEALYEKIAREKTG